MEALIYIDTHVAAWMYAGALDLFSAKALARINSEDEIRISPAAILELEYLKEIGRLTVGGRAIAHGLSAQIGLRICDLPFPGVMDSALDQDWTRDPFDRIIVGQAAIRRTLLLTKDRTIRRHYRQAVW